MVESFLRQLQRRPEEGTTLPSAVYVILLTAVLMLCAPCLYAKLAQRCRDRRQARLEASENYAVNVDAQASLEAAFANAISEQLHQTMRNILGLDIGGQDVHPLGMTKEARKEYLDNVLSTKKVVLSTQTDEEEGLSDIEAGGSPEESNDSDDFVVLRPLSPEDDDGPADGEPRTGDSLQQYETCSICIEEFRDGDEVGLSHNTLCSHFFHKACIHEWLMTHEECPCCRNPFLSFVEDEEENREAAATNRSTLNGSQRRELEQSLALARGMEIFYQLSRSMQLSGRQEEEESSADVEMTAPPAVESAEPHLNTQQPETQDASSR